jgi:hypothetical protein
MMKSERLAVSLACGAVVAIWNCFASAAPPEHNAGPKTPPSLANRLRTQLKYGTPKDKESALDAIRELKPIALIPDVIKAIDDATELPRPAAPWGKAGWGFVGHQAATVMGEIARSIDGVEIGMNAGQRPYQAYSFHNDHSDGAKKLKDSGRLSEVKKNWSKWWHARQQK